MLRERGSRSSGVNSAPSSSQDKSRTFSWLWVTCDTQASPQTHILKHSHNYITEIYYYMLVFFVRYKSAVLLGECCMQRSTHVLHKFYSFFLYYSLQTLGPISRPVSLWAGHRGPGPPPTMLCPPLEAQISKK